LHTLFNAAPIIPALFCILAEITGVKKIIKLAAKAEEIT